MFKRRQRPQLRPALRTATEALEWYPGYRERYVHDWILVHGRPREGQRLAGWARGDDGIDVFITDTPDWDRQWFKSNGMLLPRFCDWSQMYWKDYGDGLRGLSCHAKLRCVKEGKVSKPTYEAYEKFVKSVIANTTNGVCPVCSYLWSECECGIEGGSCDEPGRVEGVGTPTQKGSSTMSMEDCDGNCGTRVDAGLNTWTVEEPDDARWYFCSLRCMDSWLSASLA